MPHLVILDNEGNPIAGSEQIGHRVSDDHEAETFYVHLGNIRKGLGLDRIEGLLEKLEQDKKKD